MTEDEQTNSDENPEKNPLILCSDKRATFQSMAHSMYKMTNTSTATLYQHLILILKDLHDPLCLLSDGPLHVNH